MIYLDNNATTRIDPQVLNAMLPWLSEHYGNPSSSNSLGQVAKQALITARAQVAKFLQASPAEIIFTSGTTESNHMAILGVLSDNPSRRRIVTTAVEHSSVLSLLAELSNKGYDVVQVPVLPNGMLDMKAYEHAVTEDTALVSVMHANNETGVIFPIAELAKIAHQRGALFHTDAAQTVGKIEVNVTQLSCDLLSFSGHKLHAPKGVGVLYVKKGVALTPMFFGSQERKRRGGTENLSSIVALGMACQIASENQFEYTEKITVLRDTFQASLLANLPFAIVNGEENRVPNTCNIRFPGLIGEALLMKMDQADIIASQGSACVAGSTDPSHVMMALGLSREDALSSIRFSLSKETSALDIKTAVNSITSIVREMTAAMPVAA